MISHSAWSLLESFTVSPPMVHAPVWKQPHAPSFQSFLPMSQSQQFYLKHLSHRGPFLNLSTNWIRPSPCMCILLPARVIAPPEWDSARTEPGLPHCTSLSGEGSSLPYTCTDSWHTCLDIPAEEFWKVPNQFPDELKHVPIDKVINVVKTQG